MKLKAVGQITKNRASKRIRNGIHKVNSPLSSPRIIIPDASTAAMIMGTITGKNNTGSITSRDRVLIAIAENVVPTVTIPSVANIATGTNPGTNKGKLYKTAKIGF